MAQAEEVFLFTPTSLTGCQLWLDAADVNGNGAAVGNGVSISTWTDKSGNARNATQATGGNQPTYSSSTRGLVFNGSTSFLNMTNAFAMLGAGAAMTAFVVEKRGAASVNQMFWFTGDTLGTGVYFGYQAATTVRYTFTTTPDLETSVAAFANPDPIRLWSAGYNTTSAYRDIYLNGSLGVQSGFTGTIPVSWPGAVIGRLFLGLVDQFYNGEIYEIIFYNSYLPTSQRQQIEGYLAWKWGLQANLPSNHPFRTYRPLANPPITTLVPPMPLSLSDLQVFLPPQISGCQLWLDATDVNGNRTQPANGASVATWTDKSGFGRNAVLQSGFTAAVMATGPTTSLQTVFLNGVSRYLITYSSFPNTAYSIFGVQYNTNNANSGGSQAGYQRILHGSQTNQYLFFGTRVGFLADFTGSGTAWNDVAETTTNNYLVWRINEMIVSGSSLTILADGTSISTKTGTTGAFSDLLLGNDNLNTQPFYGNIGEIIIYSGALSISQREQVEGYLAWKWGLVGNLPNGHPYKNQQIAPFRFQITSFPAGFNTWQPSQISTLGIWFDFSDATSVTVTPGTNNITSFTNKGNLSVSGIVVQSGTPTYATARFNGLNLVQIPVGAAFRFNVAITAQPRAWFFVARQTVQLTTNTFWALINQSAGAGQQVLYIFYNGTTYSAVDTASNVGNSTAATISNPFNQFQIWTFKTSSINAGNFRNTININGSPQGLTTSSTLTYNVNPINYYLSTGSPLSSVTYPSGSDIGEVILYNQEISQSQVQQVEGYLAWKWGLVGNLPSNHPFKLFPPSP